MPNTLAHLGIQGLLTRSWLRDAEPRWILLGCVIPDVPWILNRVVLAAFPGIDAHQLFLYAIAQASLLCSLLLCGALAALTRKWRRVFLLLASNSLLHLILDACQTKWGNGVHLLAPWSWHPWNWGFFWPNSLPTYALSALGLGFGLWTVRYSRRHAIDWVWPSGPRLAAAGSLLLAYIALPALLSAGPEQADSHSVRTLHERADRAGRRVSLDRAWLRLLAGGRAVIERGDEQIAIQGLTLDHDARVSIQGRFLDSDTLLVEAIHEHRGSWRDVGSYVGLGIVFVAWGLGLVRRPRGTRVPGG